MRTEIKIVLAAALITIAVWFVVYRLGLNPHLSKRGYYGERSTLIATVDAPLVTLEIKLPSELAFNVANASDGRKF
jgi:hypothetical protein